MQPQGLGGLNEKNGGKPGENLGKTWGKPGEMVGFCGKMVGLWETKMGNGEFMVKVKKWWVYGENHGKIVGKCFVFWVFVITMMILLNDGIFMGIVWKCHGNVTSDADDFRDKR